MNAAKVTPLRRATPSLLVVEDDAVTRCLICDQLRLEGFKVLEASSAEDAIAILQTVPIHLLLVDVSMIGERNGPDVAGFAKTCRPVPKILLTADETDADDTETLREFGPLIRKPYVISQVVEVVQRSLDPTMGDGTEP